MLKLCELSQLNADNGREFTIQVDGGARFVALFLVEGEPRAYLNSCPHMGRSLNWTQDEFLIGADGRLVCPHHGATFDLSSGECMEGPCRGAHLSPVEVINRDGALYLVD